MKYLGMLAWVLLIIGGLNWGLVAIADFDLVATLFGMNTTLSRVVYGLIGLSALYMLFCWCKKDSCCR